MIAPNNSEGLIHKSDKQLLREAGQRIIALEAEILKFQKESEQGYRDIETLKVWNARLRVCLMAVGIHFKVTPYEMEQITKPALDKQLSELQEQMAEIKKQFVADLKSGKKMEFTVLENPDKPSDPTTAMPAPDAPKES